ncbi:MAG: hypothetical protein PHU14_01110 [Methylovulum sp.]|nr:hypothetical protein [Methylovulum sp.]
MNTFNPDRFTDTLASKGIAVVSKRRSPQERALARELIRQADSLPSSPLNKPVTLIPRGRFL